MPESVQRQRPRRSIFIVCVAAGIWQLARSHRRRVHGTVGWQTALLAVRIKLSADFLNGATTRKFSGY